MRVELKTSGGVAHFPGLSRPLMLSTDDLSGEDARELLRLVESARRLELPSPRTQPAPDSQLHSLTIEAAGRAQTLRFSDPMPSPAAELVAFIRSRAARSR